MKKLIVLLAIVLLSSSVMATDSLMDVGEYRNRVYDILGSDTTGNDFLDTAVVKEFVMDASMKVYSDLGTARAGKYAVPAGSSGVFVHAGLTRVIGVMWDANKELQPLLRVEAGKMGDRSYYEDLTGTGKKPKYFIRHGDSINVLPRTDKVDTLTIFFYVRGAYPYPDRPDTVSLIMPVEYRQAVVFAAAFLCEIRCGNFDRAGAFDNLYQQEVARLRTRFEIEGLIIDKGE